MEENQKVDKDYKEAFNLGYELANELNLKSPMFTDLNSKNIRVKAMQEGMEQYVKEFTLVMDKDKHKDKGLGLSL